MKISKEELIDLYIKRKLGSPAIAKKFGVSKQTILYWLRRYGIPRRAQSEAQRIWLNENKVMLAYVLGVVFGDGYSRQRKKVIMKLG
jgi:uncharacterized protein YjcR